MVTHLKLLHPGHPTSGNSVSHSVRSTIQYMYNNDDIPGHPVFFKESVCYARLMLNKTTAATPLVSFFCFYGRMCCFLLFYGRPALNAHLLHFSFVRPICFSSAFAPLLLLPSYLNKHETGIGPIIHSDGTREFPI